MKTSTVFATAPRSFAVRAFFFVLIAGFLGVAGVSMGTLATLDASDCTMQWVQDDDGDVFFNCTVANCTIDDPCFLEIGGSQGGVDHMWCECREGGPSGNPYTSALVDCYANAYWDTHYERMVQLDEVCTVVTCDLDCPFPPERPGTHWSPVCPCE